MPQCRLCNKHFPNIKKINGIRKVLSSRKYCLECSPWGKNNRKILENKTNLGTNKLCKICKRNFIYKRNGGRLDCCQSCRVSENRRRRKKECVIYKGGKCVICGYNKCLNCLDFHHLNPLEKEFSFNIGGFSNLEKVKKELDKCILLCNRCHQEVHAGCTKILNESFCIEYNI